MDNKSKKIITYFTMAIFVFALTLNLRPALDDTFTLGSELAYGSGSGGSGVNDLDGSCSWCCLFYEDGFVVKGTEEGYVEITCMIYKVGSYCSGVQCGPGIC